MVRLSLLMFITASLSATAYAADWSLFKQSAQTSLYVKSYSGVLVNQQPNHNSDNFDLWLVNTGYQYPVLNDVSLYLEGGPAVGENNSQSGFNFSSGVRYQLSPTFNIGSQIEHLELNQRSTRFELNSNLQLAPHLSLTAGYGVSAVTTEQALSLGFGFHF